MIYTPAPWTVRSTEKAHSPGHFWHEITADGFVLGEIYEAEEDEPARDAEANARLIASAPDLLEALEAAEQLRQWIVNEISSRVYEAEEKQNPRAWDGIDDCLRDGTMASYRDQFADALNKARGVQP